MLSVTSITAALVLVIAFTNSLAFVTEVALELAATFDAPNWAIVAKFLSLSARRLAVFTSNELV